MNKRNRNEDVNESAFRILKTVTAERAKNPAAVALSKLGASKGGLARAKALSKHRRKQIAKDAAKARWAQ